MVIQPPTDKIKENVVIIGDAFVDLLCVVDAEKKFQSLEAIKNGEERDTIIKPGGDVLLKYPISIMAGGSGINTATHLYSLVKQFWPNNDAINLEIQTVFNENDMYGKLLRRHATDIGFTLKNQWPEQQQPLDTDCAGGNDCTNISLSQLATGHCVVVSQGGERSFLTHRGCVEYFSPRHVNLSYQLDSSASRMEPPTLDSDKTTLNHLHIHIAGYYNLPCFWNGSLKDFLQKVKGDLTTTTVSLVPQFDATNQWDGELLDLLPNIDYLILSENEAQCITRFSNCRESSGDDEDGEKLLNHVAQTFHIDSPSARTVIIVTRGSRGAAAIQEGRVMYRYLLPLLPDKVVDTTGAGDAFAGGFLAALMMDISRSREELLDADRKVEGTPSSNSDLVNNHILYGIEQKSLEYAIRFGCAAGTACTLKKGASDPSTKEEIEHFLRLESDLDT
jgi:sugar/nucleoside kinase (ribokinase family)